MESARQWRATCRQLTLDRPTEESRRSVPLGHARGSTVTAADDTTLTGESEIRARWAGYFVELQCVNFCPDREFPGDYDAVRDADPPVSCDPPTLEETKRASLLFA